MANIHYKIGCDNVDWAQMRERLLEDDFDNGRTLEQYRISFENTHTVVIAYDGGDIIGTVRALSDGVCNAYIVDVWTYKPYRRRGIAREMMRLTLERLPGQHVYLWTDDAQDLYDSIGMQRTDDTGYMTVVGSWLQNDTR